jgi:hypothetical protein
MSTINTNGIDVNYPVPGINNSSQGFRDNFASIRTNLNTAANEITDLQNKVVVKQALNNTTINNDMANTLISNASTRSFRATTYNLGNALSGTVLIDASLADVHYGTVAGNVILQFGSWAPTGTQSNVQLLLNVSNADAVISFPSELPINENSGVTTLENYANIANVATVTVPNNVSTLNYVISTVDCGATLSIAPTNRPRIATQIQQRTPSPVGFNGDVEGDIAVSPSLNQLTITGANTDPYLTTSGNTTQLYTDMPITFTGTTLASNIVIGTTYYVRNVVSSNTFTVSSSIGGANIAIGANATGNTMFANPVSYIYVCTNDYNASTIGPKTVANTTVTTNAITLDNTTSLVVNSPIVFTGTVFGGLVANTTYYVKSISSPNITVSLSRTNGVADSVVALTTATPPANTTLYATSYTGSDIWKRIPLTSW